MTPRNKFYKVNHLDKNGILFKKKKVQQPISQVLTQQDLKISAFQNNFKTWSKSTH